MNFGLTELVCPRKWTNSLAACSGGLFKLFALVHEFVSDGHIEAFVPSLGTKSVFKPESNKSFCRVING